jgi:predicted LPLAT superfamily acyltransferase
MSWSGKSKGTVLGYRILVFSLKTFGVGVVYFMLRFVSTYYYLFDARNRNYIISFYKKTMHFSAAKAHQLCRKNFYLLAQTLIDKTAFLVGKGDVFTYDFNNEKYLIQMREEGRGGVLLSAHVGNWETAGNLLRKRITTKINVVMLDAEVEQIKSYLESTTGKSHFNIIAIKDDLSHVVKINNALSNNEFVAIHADRYLPGAKYFELDFLGQKAKFPQGPFIVASKFNAPVTFVYALKEKKYHYTLSSTLPITEKMKPEEIAKKYIEELELKVKQKPEQWFNYFDFFK